MIKNLWIAGVPELYQGSYMDYLELLEDRKFRMKAKRVLYFCTDEEHKGMLFLDGIQISAGDTGGIVDPYEPLTMELEIPGELISVGETKRIVIKVKLGYRDVTREMKNWDIERDSGDVLADKAWHARSKVKEFMNTQQKDEVTIDLCFDRDASKSDVTTTQPTTRFTISADYGAYKTTQTLTI